MLHPGVIDGDVLDGLEATLVTRALAPTPSSATTPAPTAAPAEVEVVPDDGHRQRAFDLGEPSLNRRTQIST